MVGEAFHSQKQTVNKCNSYSRTSYAFKKNSLQINAFRFYIIAGKFDFKKNIMSIA